MAFPGNGSCTVEPVASVPQESTPAALAFTSQLAALSDETVRFDVDALVALSVVAKRYVDVAFAIECFE